MIQEFFIAKRYLRSQRQVNLISLITFIDGMMELPDALKNTEEMTNMPYVTSAERIARKKGFEEAMEKSMLMIHQAIALAIQAKFGETGKSFIDRAYQMKDLEALQKLVANLTHAQNLLEVEKLLDEKEVISH